MGINKHQRLTEAISYHFDLGTTTAYYFLDRLEKIVDRQDDQEVKQKFADAVRMFLIQNWGGFADVMLWLLPRLINSPFGDFIERSILVVIFHFIEKLLKDKKVDQKKIALYQNEIQKLTFKT